MKKLVLISAAAAALLFVGCKNEVADAAGNVTAAVESNVSAVEGNASEAVAAVEGNATEAVAAVEGNVTH
jgi:PBP1b-binding outer membrane lipoprotein LpoB